MIKYNNFIKFKLFINLGISFLYFKNKKLQNFNNYLLGLRKKNALLFLNKNIFLLYQIIILLQMTIKKNGKILFIKEDYKFIELLKNNFLNQKNLHMPNNSWVDGTLTNFKVLRWFYLEKKIPIFFKLPNLIILFDSKNFSNHIFKEAKDCQIPIISFCHFEKQHYALPTYPLAGTALYTTSAVWFFFCFFSYIMNIESYLKKKNETL